MKIADSKIFVALGTGFAIFLLILGLNGLITRLEPQIYVSQAEVRILDQNGVYDTNLMNRVRKEMDSIESEKNINLVAEQLYHTNSNFFGQPGEKIEKDGVSDLLFKRLRKGLDIRTVRGTALVEIKFRSESPIEGMSVVNAFACLYRDKFGCEILTFGETDTGLEAAHGFWNFDGLNDFFARLSP